MGTTNAVASGDGTRLRSVLFVDFDNTYLGLQTLDARAAGVFAAHPERWVAWLEQGRDTAGATGRRFLAKNVYLNPVAFADQRAMFVRAGFRVVDCPPLTTRGKNSADMYMVLDIVDALVHAVRYDDFVLVSADADFTPVLHRIRAMDRRITVVTGGPAATAYRVVADVCVPAEDLAEISANGTDAGEPTVAVAAGAPGLAPAPASTDIATLPAVVAAITELVTTADKPVPAAAVAQRALDIEPRIKDLGWAGYGSFQSFVARYVPGLEYLPGPQQNFVVDPGRHSADQIPRRIRPGLGPALEQVAAVADAPVLSSQEYAALFAAVAADLAATPFALNATAKQVRNRLDLADVPIGRRPVAVVLRGLAYCEVELVGGITPRELAEAWAGYVVEQAREAGMGMAPELCAEVHAWLVGGVPEG